MEGGVIIKEHVVLGQTVNASAVLLSEGVIVIDTSVNAQGAGELFTEAGRLGEVLYVINTHEHGDHLAGNHLFNCPIISSAKAREQMLKSPAPPALPSLVFQERMVLYLGEHIQLKHFGGHCPGSAVVYFPERRLLFSGDLVFAGRVPYMGQADFRQWLEALSVLETWDVDTVVPGHGAQGGKELLTRQREWLEQYIEEVTGWSRSLSAQEILDRVLSRHQVPQRWQPMISRSIELILAEFRD